MNTRFIVLSTARTGSTLLKSLLRVHKNIRMQGEIFNLADLDSSELKKVLTDPVNVIQESFNSSAASNIQATGFKQFYNHLSRDYFLPLDHEIETQQVDELIRKFLFDSLGESSIQALFERFDAAWQYLINEKDIRIIHLKRWNKFETLVSLKTAFITNQWFSITTVADSKITMSLKPKECVKFFQQLDHHEKLYAEAFKKHPMLEVGYENLAADNHGVMRNVFKFLEVPAIEVTTSLRKQISHPMEEIVTNYEELKEYFLNTQWSYYFK